jgi:hypothetical protein
LSCPANTACHCTCPSLFGLLFAVCWWHSTDLPSLPPLRGRRNSIDPSLHRRCQTVSYSFTFPLLFPLPLPLLLFFLHLCSFLQLHSFFHSSLTHSSLTKLWSSRLLSLFPSVPGLTWRKYYILLAFGLWSLLPNNIVNNSSKTHSLL